MNDSHPPASQPPRYPGRAYLFVGLLLVMAGPVIYTVQILNKSLMAPWYFPILATLGALLIAWSLVQSRSFVRGGIAGLAALVAGLSWLFMLVGMATPPYTGPVTVGRAFPGFETTLASGRPFQQSDLQGDKSTVLLFFRGRW